MKYLVYGLITLIYIGISIPVNAEGWSHYFTTTTASLGVIILVSEALSRLISHFAQSRLEDSTKLTEDFYELMNKYKRVKLIEYRYARFPGEAIAFRGKDTPPFHFEFNHERGGVNFEVPRQIKKRSEELMKAHDCSKIYNNINVRLEGCEQSENTVLLTYSRTMYYDLLITNRAMDYPLEVEKGHTVKSVRQIYEPGPFLSSLSESKLSNHLGFNGFVELADGYIIFVLRSASVSVGKRRWNPSVSASYKTEYGLNDERKMSSKCMGNAIRREIADELKIELDKTERLEDSIFAFYRDLVEGGKPHFVFYYRLSNPIWTREYFEEHFKSETRKRKAAQKGRKKSKEEKSRYATVEDGSNFAFFSLRELKNSVLQANQLLTPSGETYKMQSDGSVSLALLMKHLTQVENAAKSRIDEWLRKNIRAESAQMPAEKRLSADDAEKLAPVLLKLLLGEIPMEDAAYQLDDILTAEELKRWKEKTEGEFKKALNDATAWIYREPKLSKVGKGKN